MKTLKILLFLLWALMIVFAFLRIFCNALPVDKTALDNAVAATVTATIFYTVFYILHIITTGRD